MKILSPLHTTATPAPDTGTERKNRFSVSRTAGTMPVYRPGASPVATTIAYAETTTRAGDITLAKSENGSFGFKDVLDTINPLQHLPVIGTIYRKATGDEISAPARLMGGALYGGPIGGALALADVAIKEQTGTTLGEKVFNLVSTDSGKQTTPTATILAQETVAAHPQTQQRMAGTIPVWGSAGAQNARFASLISELSNETNYIS